MEEMKRRDLRIEGLRARIDDFSLEADFSVRAGERAVLLGKSGSGKTRFLRILAGLEPAQGKGVQGHIFLGNQEITSLPVQKREIGFVFQNQALFDAMSVLENVTFGLRLRGFSRREREKEAALWLERMSLRSQVNSSVVSLSGGEKQRVAFIRALIWKPQLVLLDEPFSALDPDLRGVLRKELLDLHRLWPAPLILVTHDPSDIENLATTRLRLKQEDHSERRVISPMLTN